ncbi:MAG: hypothetical protein NTY19_25485 [Planctomycetota bacterium]|nr:hypothetical protein [Planctomycetota bacterium]
MRTEQILLGWLLSSCVSAIWLPAADGADADNYGAEELDNTIVDSPHGIRAANQHYVVNYRFAPDAQREIDLASDTANSYGQVGEYDCWTETPGFQPPHGSVLGCLETWRRYQRIGFNSMRLASGAPGTGRVRRIGERFPWTSSRPHKATRRGWQAASH